MADHGSTWQKWDVHLHSPSTALNNQFAGADDAAKWAAYLDRLESLGDYGGIGITDYFSLDGYYKTKAAKDSGRLQNIGIVVPNVELRITPVTDSNRAINLHVIACPTIADQLNDLLLSRLRFNFAGDSDPCTRDGLIRLGRAHRSDSGLAEAGAYKVGVEQFKIDYTQIVECFRTSGALRQKALIAVAQRSADGNSGLQESGLQALRHEIYRVSHVVFSGTPGSREYFLGRGADSLDVLQTKIGGMKPCLHGSDAHSLEKVGAPDLDRHTWIKAEPTFEGLRQVVFEPESRVWIGPTIPPTPLHKVRKVKMTLPPGARLRSVEVEQPFCFAGESDIPLAAGLTCFIGGRGAGKSTILNLLHEKVLPGKNTFWQQYQIRDENDEAVSIGQAITLEHSGDAATAEFISQNEVEALALNPSRLTAAVYSRLLSLDGGAALDAAMNALQASAGDAKDREGLLVQHQAVIESVADLEKQIAGVVELVNCFSDEQYRTLTTQLDSASRRQQELAGDRAILNALILRLESVLAGLDAPTSTTSYGATVRQTMSSIRDLITNARKDGELAGPGEEEVTLASIIEQLRSDVRAFLVEHGLSPENLSDVTAASEQRAKLEADLARQLQARGRLDSELSDETDLAAPKAAVEAAVTTLLSRVNDQFGTGAEEARRIEIQYRFDTAAAEDGAIEWLLADIQAKLPASRPRIDHARKVLERAGSILEVTDEDLLQSIRNDESKTGQSLDVYFAQAPRLAVWKSVRARFRADLRTFMRLDVRYDGRSLNQASFGQRCSAVLVVLLSLGNRPIIVDEPEAHLDSAIIADFMVDLVKRVKAHRQVIFATHNANFVINGDAELVHALTPAADGATVCRSMTIEDLDARPLLLALEGGAKAFMQREGRYGIGL